MPFDYSKLSGAIKEKYDSRADFAKALGLSERTVSLKMTGKVQWKQREILKICEMLCISEKEIPLYFFKLKVQANCT